MAIGDCYAVLLGTATTNRQPASGVLEEISCFTKFGTTDTWVMWNGSSSVNVFQATNILSETDDRGGTPATGLNPYNTSIKIGNTVYIRKVGSTDIFGISGVQVDA